MNLRNKIDEDYKYSIKNKDQDKINTLRLIKSAIKDKDISLRSSTNKYGNDFENILFGSWAILFSILIIDIIFEIIFGFNTVGIKSIIPGRVASFFGNELVVGSLRQT